MFSTAGRITNYLSGKVELLKRFFFLADIVPFDTTSFFSFLKKIVIVSCKRNQPFLINWRSWQKEHFSWSKDFKVLYYGSRDDGLDFINII